MKGAKRSPLFGRQIARGWGLRTQISRTPVGRKKTRDKPSRWGARGTWPASPGWGPRMGANGGPPPINWSPLPNTGEKWETLAPPKTSGQNRPGDAPRPFIPLPPPLMNPYYSPTFTCPSPGSPRPPPNCVGKLSKKKPKLETKTNNP